MPGWPKPVPDSYSARAAELVEQIEAICQANHDPHKFHEAKDLAVRKAKFLQRALATDGL